jgi:hypothetical protein
MRKARKGFACAMRENCAIEVISDHDFDIPERSGGGDVSAANPHQATLAQSHGGDGSSGDNTAHQIFFAMLAGVSCLIS